MVYATPGPRWPVEFELLVFLRLRDLGSSVEDER
jgi:hypothetical protein